MQEYLSLIEHVWKNGEIKKDRTKVGTISLFGTQTRYNLQKGFPLITTKKIHWSSLVHELLWFIKGDTNIKYLVENNVRIWNEWPFEKFKKSPTYNGETIKEFIFKIKNNRLFAKKHGDLGPIYGFQWRNFNGVDQLANVIHDLKKQPNI